MPSKRSLAPEDGSPETTSKRHRAEAPSDAVDDALYESDRALVSLSPTHHYHARLGIQRSIALILNHDGFSSATPEAMDSFTSLVESYLESLIEQTKTFALSSRRELPIPTDFGLALRFHNLTTASLRPHLKHPLSRRPQLAPAYGNVPTADADALRTLPLLSQELSGQADKDAKRFIPASFPDFPSRHTYCHTPQEETGGRDSKKIREEAARTAQQGEDALRRLVRASKMRKQKEAKTLVERDSHGRERFRLWESTMRRFMGSDGRGDNAGQVEIADHSMIVNGDAAFARKDVSRLGKRSTTLPVNGGLLSRRSQPGPSQKVLLTSHRQTLPSLLSSWTFSSSQPDSSRLVACRTAMAEQLILKGTLESHTGWVTSLATSMENPNMLLSGSRDGELIIWNLTRDESQYGYPKRSLRGHSHIVSDCVISSDGAYALSASWDKTLRLWELATGQTTRRFVGHTNDVLSVSFSADNRQIVSGSRDRSIKLWNTLGDCKYTITDKGHGDWVSCVRFSPNPQNPVIVSSSWDKLVKVWELSTCKLQTDHIGHTGYINTVTISPDGSLCASGGKDGTTMLWDLNESKHLYSLNANDEIHALVFSPNRYWLCAATASSIIIFDLEKKSKVDELKPDFASVGKKSRDPECISLAWSADGQTLFAGYTDKLIRAWGVMSRA
ncbi:hypothetical protein XA68_10480 [Ophiocordyceps unilateralis]|uniref:Uncharacterized protein n=1 Tax=Ophiocordyceps unilateralis TaxID=268505 RepID=A0A2A9PHM9_OPHUN|nr:hypothetical protein XA68_10480 [Ophiocordyceps unilateralis]